MASGWLRSLLVFLFKEIRKDLFGVLWVGREVIVNESLLDKEGRSPIGPRSDIPNQPAWLNRDMHCTCGPRLDPRAGMAVPREVEMFGLRVTATNGAETDRLLEGRAAWEALRRASADG